ncbi:MAG: hypothetical protein U1F66_09715 [bacterium]
MNKIPGPVTQDTFQIQQFHDENHNGWVDPEEPVQVQMSSTGATASGRTVIEKSEFKVSAKEFCLSKAFQGFGSSLTRFANLQGNLWNQPYSLTINMLLLGQLAAHPAGLHRLSLTQDFQENNLLKLGLHFGDDEAWRWEYLSTLGLAKLARTDENHGYDFIEGVSRLEKIGERNGMNAAALALIKEELEDIYILAKEGHAFDQRAYALGELLASGEPMAFEAFQELLRNYEKKCEYLMVSDAEKRGAIERVRESFYQGFIANPAHRDYLKNTPLNEFPYGFLSEEALRIWKAALGG